MSIFDQKNIEWKGSCTFYLYLIIQKDNSFKKFKQYGKYSLWILISTIIFIFFVVKKSLFGIEDENEYLSIACTTYSLGSLVIITYLLIKRSRLHRSIGEIVFSANGFDIKFSDQKPISYEYDYLQEVSFLAGRNSFMSNVSMSDTPNTHIKMVLKDGRKFELLISFTKIENKEKSVPANLYEVFELIRRKNHYLYVMLKDTIEINYLNQNNYSKRSL